jgi:hypothetical protein
MDADGDFCLISIIVNAIQLPCVSGHGDSSRLQGMLGDNYADEPAECALKAFTFRSPPQSTSMPSASSSLDAGSAMSSCHICVLSLTLPHENIIHADFRHRCGDFQSLLPRAHRTRATSNSPSICSTSYLRCARIPRRRSLTSGSACCVLRESGSRMSSDRSWISLTIPY